MTPDPFNTWWSFCQRPDFDGNADDTADDGAGTTRWGFTWPTWRHARLRVGETDLSFAAFLACSQADMEPLARAEFWAPLLCDRMGGPTAVMVCDFAFGSGGAVRVIQRELGAAVDGILGPATLACIQAVAPLDFVARCCAWRKAYYDACGFRARFPGLYRRTDACAVVAEGMLE